MPAGSWLGQNAWWKDSDEAPGFRARNAAKAVQRATVAVETACLAVVGTSPRMLRTTTGPRMQMMGLRSSWISSPNTSRTTAAAAPCRGASSAGGSSSWTGDAAPAWAWVRAMSVSSASVMDTAAALASSASTGAASWLCSDSPSKGTSSGTASRCRTGASASASSWALRSTRLISSGSRLRAHSGPGASRPSVVARSVRICAYSGSLIICGVSCSPIGAKVAVE